MWATRELRRRKGRTSEVTGTPATERRRTPSRWLTPVTLPSLTKSVPVTGGRAVSREVLQGTVVTQCLEEVRSGLGADELVLWRLPRDADANGAARLGSRVSAEPRAALTAAAWVTPEGTAVEGRRRPPTLRAQAWLPAVERALTERTVQCESAEGKLTFAAAPWLVAGGDAYALTVWAASGLRVPPDAVHQRLQRAASLTAEMAHLVQTLRQYERRVREANVLVNSARMFQSKQTIEDLSQTVCRDALQLTSGARAALVRWEADAHFGIVQSVSPGHSIEVGQRVFAKSVVGALCSEDQSQPWEDARHLDRSTPLYGGGERLVPLGSLLVVPMKQDQRVVGAIVVEGDAPGDVRARDIAPVRTLAAIASASLDQLWRIQEARRASITDQLTGLYNRRQFDEELIQRLEEADRSGLPVSLIVADADHFKRVNDRYGHEAGDAVLKSIADHLRRGARDNDLCARYGGEEMAIVLPGTGLLEALEVAERLRRAIDARPVVVGDERIKVSVSFGVACYPETVASHGAIFPAADRAMYGAKSAGRNTVMSNAVIDSPATI